MKYEQLLGRGLYPTGGTVNYLIAVGEDYVVFTKTTQNPIVEYDNEDESVMVHVGGGRYRMQKIDFTDAEGVPDGLPHGVFTRDEEINGAIDLLIRILKSKPGPYG